MCFFSMKRVENNEEWTLFCPSKAAHLLDLYGPEFENEYQLLESNGIGKETINARTLWRHIMECIQEIGSPCILFKESINGKKTMPLISNKPSSHILPFLGASSQQR